MKAAVRKKQGENLDDATLSRVVELLNREVDPISKKEACEILNISYNTSRLNRIVEEYIDRAERIKLRKQQLRGKPTDLLEEKSIVSAYLSGDALSTIADESYRSAQVVKRVLEKYNIPERLRGVDSYSNPPLIPDVGITEDYEKGDLVFAARYNSAATVDKLHSVHPVHGKVYKLWIHGDYCCYALQPYYELADLRKAQKELEIKIEDLPPEEVRALLLEAYLKAKKGKSKDE